MKKLMLGMVAMAALAGPTLAQTVEERLISGLKGQGYVIVEDGYTFLGRLRVVAQSDKFHREIVVNPGTGEVLRDYSVERQDTGSDSGRPAPAAPNATPAPAVPDDLPAAGPAIEGAADGGAADGGAEDTTDTEGAADGSAAAGAVDGGGDAATPDAPDIVSEPAVSVEETAP